MDSFASDMPVKWRRRGSRNRLFVRKVPAYSSWAAVSTPKGGPLAASRSARSKRPRRRTLEEAPRSRNGRTALRTAPK